MKPVRITKIDLDKWIESMPDVKERAHYTQFLTTSAEDMFSMAPPETTLQEKYNKLVEFVKSGICEVVFWDTTLSIELTPTGKKIRTLIPQMNTRE